MAGDAVLVLGATGPSGICLLRELLHRNYRAIAYARNPSKIPDDLKSNPLLEIVHSPIDHHPSLSQALSRAHAVISFLGPSPQTVLDTLMSFAYFGPPLPYPRYYAEDILPLMQTHGVRRILALSTLSAAVHDEDDPRGEGDRFVLSRWLTKVLVRVMVPKAYWAMVGIARVFGGLRGQEVDLDWTVFRVPMLLGGADDESWRREREERKGVYAGPIRPRVWKGVMGRARLARWCVDWLERGGNGEWKGRMPAVCDAKRDI
ncbi:Flavin reductase (NADPH) [Madurella mycetomatis]|uniref:Flavin reductase (NADPH) n=1 Tax=Madurella mycetomatis TaxID=100816 RepID=A0A175W8G8_9PEZI|nr:Flavin reductase (NADPH) [Madurella mycetomatis]